MVVDLVVTHAVRARLLSAVRTTCLHACVGRDMRANINCKGASGISETSVCVNLPGNSAHLICGMALKANEEKKESVCACVDGRVFVSVSLSMSVYICGRECECLCARVCVSGCRS